MQRLTVAITEDTADRLDRLAEREYRDRKQQAAMLLVEALKRAGGSEGTEHKATDNAAGTEATVREGTHESIR